MPKAWCRAREAVPSAMSDKPRPKSKKTRQGYRTQKKRERIKGRIRLCLLQRGFHGTWFLGRGDKKSGLGSRSRDTHSSRSGWRLGICAPQQTSVFQLSVRAFFQLALPADCFGRAWVVTWVSEQVLSPSGAALIPCC